VIEVRPGPLSPSSYWPAQTSTQHCRTLLPSLPPLTPVAAAAAAALSRRCRSWRVVTGEERREREGEAGESTVEPEAEEPSVAVPVRGWRWS